jgi:outer membrane biosynthesis protein TonB
VEAAVPAVVHKIRASLVELRTNNGFVYLRPSFWQRIYLLWTFRHFRSLPRQVLNRRQQQLIDRLCRTAVVAWNGPIARTCIIGVVENAYLVPDYKTAAVTSASKLVEIATNSAQVVEPRAVGSEGIAIRPVLTTYDPSSVERFRRPGTNLRYLSAPQPVSVAHNEAKEMQPASVERDGDRDKTRSRKRFRWAQGVAWGVLLLAVLFYFREGKIASPVAPRPVAFEAHQAISGGVPSSPVAQPEKLGLQSLPVEREEAATMAPMNSPSSTASSRQHNKTPGKTIVLTPPPVSNIDSPAAERLQVAGPPERGFSYPVAPAPALAGKVSLKALIRTDGTVREVEVLSGNRTLALAAVRTVRHWKYRTYQLDGQAVEAETNITISFVGDDAVSVSFPPTH